MFTTIDAPRGNAGMVAVLGSIRTIPAQDWTRTQVRTAHGGTRTVELAATAHAMNTGSRGFRMVVERRVDVEEGCADDALPLAVLRTRIHYWPIATNDDTMACAEMVAFYNRRQGASEQGNESLKHDVCIGTPSCRGEHGLALNRVFACSCTARHKLFECFKHAR